MCELAFLLSSGKVDTSENCRTGAFPTTQSSMLFNGKKEKEDYRVYQGFRLNLDSRSQINTLESLLTTFEDRGIVKN